MSNLIVKVYRNDTYAVVTVTNHEDEDGTCESKPKIDLEFCQDVSGSMATQCSIQSTQGSASVTRLQLCQATLQFIIRYLKNQRMGLTSFDSNSKVVVPFQTVGDDLSVIEQRIGQLVPGSSTNLSGGLQTSLLELQATRDSEVVNDVTRVKYLMVFTDGDANSGIIDESKLITLLKTHIETIQGNVRVVLFAFGEGCNHDLLQNLAEGVGGSYYSLQTADDIPTAIGEAFGTALETRQQNLEFIVPPELMDTMPGEEPSFPDILRGESRSRLFRLMDPETFGQGIFKFRYLDCDTAETVNLSVDCSEAETNPVMVSETFNIHDVAETTRLASNLWGAQRKELLNACLERILASVSSGQERVQLLVTTLREQLERGDLCPPSLLRQCSTNTRNFRSCGYASKGVAEFSQVSHLAVSDNIFASIGNGITRDPVQSTETRLHPLAPPTLVRSHTSGITDQVRGECSGLPRGNG